MAYVMTNRLLVVVVYSCHWSEIPRVEISDFKTGSLRRACEERIPRAEVSRLHLGVHSTTAQQSDRNLRQSQRSRQSRRKWKCHESWPFHLIYTQ